MMKIILVALFLLLPIITNGVYAAGESRTKSIPVQKIQALAESGAVAAQFNLGVMYKEGRGVTQDDKQAFYWIEKAARQEFAQAQYNLGLMYKEGRGATQDSKQAVYWLGKAAKQGFVKVQSD